MSDEPQTPEPNGAAPAQQQMPQITQRILAQYVRDLSFENVMVQKGVTGEATTPEINVQVKLDARKRNVDHQFEVVTMLNVTSKSKSTGDTLFLMELEYAGVFHIEGVPDNQMHPYLLIECPRMTFPFVRRIVSDVTRDGGFPPLNLETIDFLNLYRAELARRAKEQEKAPDAVAAEAPRDSEQS